MVAGKDVCLRRLAKGVRAQEVRFNRFLGNAKVTTARVIESWSEGTVTAAEGRHVLAIQDTSEINFPTTAARRRGLGEIGKGVGRGVLVHGMLAQIDWSLGRFGDRRLDKGGWRSSNAWSRARMSACGGLRGVCGRGRCGSTAFSATPR